EVADGDEDVLLALVEPGDGVADLLRLRVDDQVPDVADPVLAGRERPAPDVGFAAGDPVAFELAESTERRAGLRDRAADDRVLASVEPAVVVGRVGVVAFAVEEAAVGLEERGAERRGGLGPAGFVRWDPPELVAARAEEVDPEAPREVALEPGMADGDQDVAVRTGEVEVEVTDQPALVIDERAFDLARITALDVVDGRAAQVRDGSERFGLLGAGAVDPVRVHDTRAGPAARHVP